jgi:osmotically-inducible protein OsmY
MGRRRLLAPSLLLALAISPLGCGSEEETAMPAPTPEAAAAQLESAHLDVETLRARVAETQQASERAEAEKEAAEAALEAANEAYDRARNALRDAEQKLASLMPPPPSDEEVFRRVQKQLLDAPALAQVAIKAEVAERKVTLHGNVPDDATRDAAVSIAGAVDGVASVESEIRVGSH